MLCFLKDGIDLFLITFVREVIVDSSCIENILVCVEIFGIHKTDF